VRWGGPAWSFLDDVAALVVVVAILWSSFRLFQSGSSELMDVQADQALVEAVRAAAERVMGVRGVEKLWLRKSGLEFFADIHIEVDGSHTVADGHAIGHRVKDALLAEFDELRDVLVHLEPFPPHCHNRDVE
jgi:divalent metal cation (Fe/Co/Zn/Cd) transporter